MEQAISYRDRDGFVVMDGQSVKRYVSFSYADTYDHLTGSGLYDRLVNEGLLIPHKEITPDPAAENHFYKVLEPEWIPFISLPYEWTASQWKEAILTFLRINSIGMQHGMILKDATPFNFCFYCGRCIFFDTLSFEIYKEGAPWVAYRQFCELFLGPFALICFNDVRWSAMLQSGINGWPLSFISKNLPFRTWFNPVLLTHIHLHASVSVRKTGEYKGKKDVFSSEKLLLLWDMIEKSVRKWHHHPSRIGWNGYYDKGILSDTYLNSKTAIITQWLEKAGAHNVIDLGANNGMFSIIAASHVKHVLAIESDHECVEQIRENITAAQLRNIDTVLADITIPTPATGWENKERFSLLQRVSCDLLLALAVIHHICIGSNVPLVFTARLFAGLTNRYLLIEFVPRNDPKVAGMLANRKDIFTDYTEDVFIAAYQQYFKLVDTADCDASGRKLYLWEKR